MPNTSTTNPDVLDIQFQDIFQEQLKALPDMIPSVFSMIPHNGRADIRFSDVGELEDFIEFDGQVGYDRLYDGYDVVATYREWVRGLQIERKLMDDDQFSVFSQRPRAMANAAHRTRQKHGAQVYNKAFSAANDFYTHSEGVPLCSSAHTNTTGASTANGFDNAGTSALSATALETARQAMIGFRDDRANRISITPNQIVTGPGNAEVAYEIVESRGKVDVANNNANFHNGSYQILVWNYIEDANDWFLEDTMLKSDMLFWSDRIPLEFAMVEDFDTFYAKWRGYMRYTWTWQRWHWVYGSQVS